MSRKFFLLNCLGLYATVIGYMLIILYYMRDGRRENEYERTPTGKMDVSGQVSAGDFGLNSPFQEDRVNFSAEEKTGKIRNAVGMPKITRNEESKNLDSSFLAREETKSEIEARENGIILYDNYSGNRKDITLPIHKHSINGSPAREKRTINKFYNYGGGSRPYKCNCPGGQVRRKVVFERVQGFFKNFKKIVRVKCICKKMPTTTMAPTTTAKPTTTPKPTTTTTTTAKTTTTTTTERRLPPYGPFPWYPLPPQRPSGYGYGFGYGYGSGGGIGNGYGYGNGFGYGNGYGRKQRKRKKRKRNRRTRKLRS